MRRKSNVNGQYFPPGTIVEYKGGVSTTVQVNKPYTVERTVIKHTYKNKKRVNVRVIYLKEVRFIGYRNKKFKISQK